VSLIRKGERIVISHGAYSDYRILTIAEATEDFDAEFARKEFVVWANLKSLTSKSLSDANEYQFLAWLEIVRRLIVEVPVDWREWHLGDYGLSHYDKEDAVSPWRDVEFAWAADWPGKDAREEVEKANG
jgi:hypothetical protein